MSSSASVSATSFAMPSRTVSGEPTMERASMRIACAFSVGDQKVSMSSIGGWLRPPAPRKKLASDIFFGGAQHPAPGAGGGGGVFVTPPPKGRGGGSDGVQLVGRDSNDAVWN